MPKLSISELEQTAEWRALTRRQQAFLKAFIATEGNRVESVAMAYNFGQNGDEHLLSKRARENARTFSYRVMRSDTVRAALYRWRGVDPEVGKLQDRISKLQDEIYADVRNPEVPVERVSAKRNVLKDLQAQLEKLNAPALDSSRPVTRFEPPDTPEPKATESKTDPDDMFAAVERQTGRKY